MSSFENAVAFINALESAADPQKQLQLYGLYKVALVSPRPLAPRPGFFDMRGRAKWDAWNTCPASSSAEAQSSYMDVARQLGWTEGEVASAPRKAESKAAWISVSAPQTAVDGDVPASPLHDAVARGDIQSVRDALSREPQRVNEADPYGNTLLHIAADRGRLDVARLLLEKGAQIGAKDHDGQTPKDAAELAEQTELVSLLSTSVK